MKEKRYYIAYGSNLNVGQMRMRCPHATILGTANLKGWELLFKGSKTGSYLTIEESEGVPRCACGGTIKPDVVLYEEPLDEETWAAAVRAIAEADVLIVGGTSLTVYPAAALLDAYCGQKLALINRDATPRDDAAALVLRGSIGEILGSIA